MRMMPDMFITGLRKSEDFHWNSLLICFYHTKFIYWTSSLIPLLKTFFWFSLRRIDFYTFSKSFFLLFLLLIMFVFFSSFFYLLFEFQSTVALKNRIKVSLLREWRLWHSSMPPFMIVKVFTLVKATLWFDSSVPR